MLARPWPARNPDPFGQLWILGQPIDAGARPDVRTSLGVPADYQPRARHSGSEGRSAPSVLSLPWPG